MDLSELLRNTWQTTLVFIALFTFTRFLGKTQIGQLTFYEYISGITIGSIAGNIVAAEPDKYVSHFYDLILFVILTYLLSFITIKSRKARNIIEGTCTILIENGKILKDNMLQTRLDLDELNAQLRQQGILDISDVQFAILETSGTISIIKKSQQQGLTKEDIGIGCSYQFYPIELISDGEILTENLHAHNISEEWLYAELSLQGIEKIEDVLYSVLDSKGKLFVSKQPTCNARQ